MYTVTANYSKDLPATAANVNARQIRSTPIDPIVSGPTGRQVWISGLPITPGRSLRAALAALAGGELSATVEALTAFDGAFAAFVWDPQLHKLVVVTDFLGVQPLYMRRRRGEIAFAGTIRELADAPQPDPAGWGAFVGFGHFIGDRTSVAGVTRVTPATILEYEPETDRLSMRTYWRWPDVQPQMTEPDTGELLDLITASIGAYGEYASEGTLLLSGGYESRLLAALLVRAGARPGALTLRNPYEHLEIDGRFAARVARELGIRHEVRDPDPDFFSTDRYVEYVRLSDVGTTSVNLFIAQVCAELQDIRAPASWDGVCYGTVIKDKSAASFEAFLRKTLKPLDAPAWQAARRVFAPSFVDGMWTEMQSTLSDEIAACHEGPAGVAEFFVRNRARNRTTPNALKVYANFLLPFMPGLTKDFYGRAVPIPPGVKAGDGLYRRILERHFPRLARLPFCSGGELLPGTRPSLEYRLLAARSAVVEHPRIGNVLRRLGVTPAPSQSAAVAGAVRRADPDDPILYADGIRDLQRTPARATNEDTFARELVFYWSAWREVTGGAPGCGLQATG
jgi:hypothetical protein